MHYSPLHPWKSIPRFFLWEEKRGYIRFHKKPKQRLSSEATAEVLMQDGKVGSSLREMEWPFLGGFVWLDAVGVDVLSSFLGLWRGRSPRVTRV